MKIKDNLPKSGVILGSVCLLGLTAVTDANAAKLRIVVDNQDAGFSTTGSWYESSAEKEFRTSSVYARSNGSATWRTELPESGHYRVQVWWTYWPNRAKKAPYTISHMNGETTVRVNQKNVKKGGKWVTLGAYDFTAGAASVKLLREPGDNETTSADAVRFVKIGELVVQPPPPPPPPPPPLPPGDISKMPTDLIKVDQFGYLPDMRKVAILSNPKIGFNVPAAPYTPALNLEVRRVADDGLVYSGAITAWKQGATDPQSGDQVWHFDFSALNTAGSYYIYDPQNQLASAPFEIKEGLYLPILKSAVKTYFYQRAGMAKLPPYADTAWADSASHLGVEMDNDCRALNPSDPRQSDPSTSLDLSGGWYDAGDFNKYVNYADGVLHELLFAYEEAPQVWGDDWNFPESGNGIPDLLDEVRYELDWLLKMQQVDGGVLHKVASISWDFSESGSQATPAQDQVPRRYAPVTASATISAAGAFAHAAKVFGQSDPAYATQLRAAALLAWQWLANHENLVPSSFNNTGFVNAAAEDSAYAQSANRLNAAIYLYALTGDGAFHAYIREHQADSRLLSNDAYLQYDGIDYESQNALLYYASLENTDTVLASKIQQDFFKHLSNPYVDFAPKLQAEQQTDAYMAYLDAYSWGSNRAKSQAGNTLLAPVVYAFASQGGELEQGAGQFLHYLHGANPMSQVYLSNMGAYGAENPVDQFYHLWFRDGSLWDSTKTSYGPPPGFLVGGANEYYGVTGVKINETSSEDIKSQPAAKKYRSWNTLGDSSVRDHKSYQISENSITYQAAYVRLLSKFVK
ncbi:MAG: glycoside hydrolase family 9 protein [Gammaproteobacteria bacterium]|nr:glycoside hydrolase family 9 protein [Gammaproteobacteria bacterium]MBU1724793.1 glycoside hydrolase family 9 protein [Gammaproteobacteria bacterium]MBU2006544.1 glycoside hydrolase family 9 protein [Gammaproteobacteria bacterium]